MRKKINEESQFEIVLKGNNGQLTRLCKTINTIATSFISLILSIVRGPCPQPRSQLSLPATTDGQTYRASTR